MAKVGIKGLKFTCAVCAAGAAPCRRAKQLTCPPGLFLFVYITSRRHDVNLHGVLTVCLRVI